jgi:MFS family permease
MRALAVVATAHAGLHVYTTMMPLVYPFVLAEFDTSYTVLGLLLTVAGTGGALAQFLSAQLPAWLPSRVILATGLGVVAAGAVVSSTAIGFAGFASGRMISQIGQGPQHVIANTLIAQLFDRKSRGRTFAFHFAAGNLGGLLAPIIFLPLMSVMGWRGALALLALPLVCLLFVLILFVPEPMDRHRTDHPHGRGLRSLVAAALSPLSNRGVRPVIAAGALAAGGRGNGILLVFVPLLLQNHFNLPIADTAFLYMVLVLGSIIGPLIVGSASDRIARKSVVTGTLILASAATVGIIMFGSFMPALISAIMVMSLTAFGNGAQLQALLADNSRTEAEARAGFGAYFLLVHLAGGLWPLLIAAVLDLFGFVAAFALIACSYIAAASALALVPPATPGFESQASANATGKGVRDS